MFDTLTLTDLYTLHKQTAIALAPMIDELTKTLELIDRPHGAAHWTPEGEALVADANARMAAIRERRELMSAAYAEIQRRQQDADADA